jgi:ribosomal protein L37AE/L43A
MTTLTPQKEGSSGGLADAIDRILDKGLVINADIAVSVAGVELLGIKIRAALASFETAAKYGLEFPSGTNLETKAWKEATKDKEQCPQCSKIVETDQLLNDQCPWCGWKSASTKIKEEALVKVKLPNCSANQVRRQK